MSVFGPGHNFGGGEGGSNIYYIGGGSAGTNLTYRYEYDAEISYNPNDMVNYNEGLYICQQTSLNHLPSDASYWKLMIAYNFIDMNFRDVYLGGTTYNKNDCVNYNGRVYICKLETSGNLPTNTTYWSEMIQGYEGSVFSWQGDWTARIYNFLNVVLYTTTGGVYLVNNVNGVSAIEIPGTSSKWTLLAQGLTIENTLKLSKINDATNNVMIGVYSGEPNNASTSRNTAVGYQAFRYGIADSTDNTILGYAAGRYTNGYGNVIIGAEAGYISGNGNVILGYKTSNVGIEESHKYLLGSYNNSSSTNYILARGDFTTGVFEIPGSLTTPLINGNIKITGHVIANSYSRNWEEFYDDFIGSVLSDSWTVAVSGTGATAALLTDTANNIMTNLSSLQLYTPNINSSSLATLGKFNISMMKDFEIEFRTLAENNNAQVASMVYFGLYENGGANEGYFYVKQVGTGNYLIDYRHYTNVSYDNIALNVATVAYTASWMYWKITRHYDGQGIIRVWSRTSYNNAWTLNHEQYTGLNYLYASQKFTFKVGSSTGATPATPNKSFYIDFVRIGQARE